MRILKLLFPLLLPISLFAGNLAPQQSATLYQHLKEVNPQITQHVQEEAILTTEVSFTNDIERIQAHLSFVEQYLREHQPEGLKPEALEARNEALDNLHAYWMAGNFPQNIGHPMRQPYFIDDRGVACAVGQLMVESGYAGLAEEIRAERNFGYVRDLKNDYPEIGDWALSHGFTADELAWIQPAYQPMENWEAMGYGTNGTVSVVFEDPTTNNIILAGSFTEADSQTHNMVAAWNGSSYEALGAGVSGIIQDGLFYDGDIWLFGSFTDMGGGMATIARYHANTWTYSNPFPGAPSVTTAAKVHGDSLMFAGYYDGFAGRTHYLASYRNGNYNQVETINETIWLARGPIEDIEFFDGQFYICGDFDANISPQFPPAPVLTLGPFGFYLPAQGMDNVVHDMEVINGERIVGGEFFDDNNNPTMGLAAFDGTQWQGLIDVTMHHAPGDSTQGAIYDIFEYNDGVLIAGDLMTAPIIIGTYGSYLLSYSRVNDTTAMLTGISLINAPAHTVCNSGSDIYVGGEFTLAGGFNNPVNHIMFWERTANNVPDLPKVRTLSSYPNPASSQTFIAYGQASEDMQVRVYNLNGEEMGVNVDVRQNGFELQRDNLSDGLYIYQITDGKGLIGTGKVWFY
jgi:hypothetical protein